MTRANMAEHWIDTWMNEVPSVEWEMRKGKWILLDNSQLTGQYALLYKSDDWMNYQCSCCKYMVHNSLKESYDYRTALCPKCRAKMEVEE